MVEVTEEDRCLVADIIEGAGSGIDHAGLVATADLIRAGRYDDYPAVQIAATHREAAAKAERDRLRAQASLEKIARSIGRETVARDDRGILFDDLPEEDKATVLEMLAAALADALESQHD